MPSFDIPLTDSMSVLGLLFDLWEDDIDVQRKLTQSEGSESSEGI